MPTMPTVKVPTQRVPRSSTLSRALCTALCLSLGAAYLPRSASAHVPTGPVALKKGKGKSDPYTVTPEDAASERESVRGRVKGDLEAEKYEAAAAELQQQGAKLGDPALFIDAAEALNKAASSARSIALAESAKEPARIALDILAHLSDSASDYQVVARDDVGTLTTKAESQIGDADRLIDEIKSESDRASDADEASAPVASEKHKKPRKKAAPGSGLLAGGSILTLIGAGGLGMIGAGMAISKSKQSELEDLGAIDPADPVAQAKFKDIDDAGKNANLIAYAGIGVAAVGLAAGIALLVLGAKKRRAGGGAPLEQAARIHVSPTLRGVVVGGRF